MRTLVVSGLGAALMLAAVGGAPGKAPPSGILICGQGECQAIPAADAERVLISLYGSDSEPAAPAPFFVLRWQWNAREQRAWWVPRSGLVRGLDGAWTSLNVASEAVLRSSATGLEPFPVPTVTRVVVGRRLAENPQSYLLLLHGGQRTSPFDGARGWISVRLASVEPSPWTNGSTWLMVSEAGRWVWRDARIYRIPQSLVERARRGMSLTPFARGR